MARASIPSDRTVADAWDKDDDDWPNPEAREAAQRHRAADDDSALESIGKAISAPVMETGDAEAAKAAERKP